MSLCCCDTEPPPPPPPTAACCLPRDDPTNPEGCEVLSEADCNTRNGIWLPTSPGTCLGIDCVICPACSDKPPTGMYPLLWNIPGRDNLDVTFVDVRLDPGSAFQPGGIVYEDINTRHTIPRDPSGPSFGLCETRKTLNHGGLFFQTIMRVNYIQTGVNPLTYAIQTWLVNAAAGLSGTPRNNDIGAGVNCDAGATYPLVYANAGSMVYHGPS